MDKRTIAAVILAGTLILAAGCDNNSNTPSIEAVNPSGPNAPAGSGAAPQENDKREAGFSEKDLEINIGGIDIKLGTNIKEITGRLGDDYDFSEAISCAYDGMDKTFIYPGLELYTYPEKEDDFLFEATLVDDTYSTSAGIAVGATEEEIRAVYGESCFKEGLVLRYNLSNNPDNLNEPSIYFIIEDGKAAMIGIALGEREV